MSHKVGGEIDENIDGELHDNEEETQNKPQEEEPSEGVDFLSSNKLQNISVYDKIVTYLKQIDKYHDFKKLSEENQSELINWVSKEREARRRVDVLKKNDKITVLASGKVCYTNKHKRQILFSNMVAFEESVRRSVDTDYRIDARTKWTFYKISAIETLKTTKTSIKDLKDNIKTVTSNILEKEKMISELKGKLSAEQMNGAKYNREIAELKNREQIQLLELERYGETEKRHIDDKIANLNRQREAARRHRQLMATNKKNHDELMAFEKKKADAEQKDRDTTFKNEETKYKLHEQQYELQVQASNDQKVIHNQQMDMLQKSLNRTIESDNKTRDVMVELARLQNEALQNMSNRQIKAMEDMSRRQTESIERLMQQLSDNMTNALKK